MTIVTQICVIFCDVRKSRYNVCSKYCIASQFLFFGTFIQTIVERNDGCLLSAKHVRSKGRSCRANNLIADLNLLFVFPFFCQKLLHVRAGLQIKQECCSTLFVFTSGNDLPWTR